MGIPEPVRELRPHIIFKILEKITDRFWEIGGGAVMASILWLVSKLRSNLDYVSIGVVFVVAVIMMYLSVRRSSVKNQTDTSTKQTTSPEPQLAPAKSPSSGVFNVRLTGPNVEEMKAMRTTLVERDLTIQELNKRIVELSADDGKRDPSGGLKKAVEEQALLSAAPDVLVFDYMDDGTKAKIRLYNDGLGTAHNLRFGPLKVAYERGMHSHVPMPAIPSKNSFFLNNLGIEADRPLFHFLREQTPANATTTVDLYYDDQTGRGFIKTFALVTGIDGSLVWNPRRVRLQQPVVVPTE